MKSQESTWGSFWTPRRPPEGPQKASRGPRGPQKASRGPPRGAKHRNSQQAHIKLTPNSHRAHIELASHTQRTKPIYIIDRECSTPDSSPLAIRMLSKSLHIKTAIVLHKCMKPRCFKKQAGTDFVCNPVFHDVLLEHMACCAFLTSCVSRFPFRTTFLYTERRQTRADTFF